jgi:hypothetical protein
MTGTLSSCRLAAACRRPPYGPNELDQGSPPRFVSCIISQLLSWCRATRGSSFASLEPIIQSLRAPCQLSSKHQAYRHKKTQSEPHSPHHISKQDAQLHPHSLTLAAIPLSPPRPGSSEENYSVIPDLHPATTLLEHTRLTSTLVSFTLIQ